jgi:toxin ParE1/3/4
MKALHWRPAARRDADEAAIWFAGQGGQRLELAFIDALQSTLQLIQRHPAAGSSRHSELYSLLPAPLRFHPIRSFDRYLIYYVELPSSVQIVRISNASRGLDALIAADS